MAVGKKSLSSVSVGLGFVYGIGRKGAPVVADVAKLLGKGGRPKKPGKKQSDNPKILDRFRINFHYHYRYL
jgi:hypothetical protein